MVNLSPIYGNYDNFKSTMLSQSHGMLDEDTISVMWCEHLGVEMLEPAGERKPWLNDKIENLAPGMWSAQLRGVVTGITKAPKYNRITVVDADCKEIDMFDFKKVCDISNIEVGSYILIEEARSDENSYNHKTTLYAFSRTVVLVLTPELEDLLLAQNQ